MKNFVEFIQTNWSYLSVALICVLEFILMFIKKRSKTVLTDKGLLSDLCQLIIEAETKFVNGQDKLTYVLSKYKETHPMFYQELTESAKKSSYPWDKKTADDFLIPFIEYLLTMPTKKGGLGREQVEQEKK